MKIDQIEKKLSHCLGRAISDYNMISHGDRVMICLSGGKDSFTLLTLLRRIQLRAKVRFTLHSFTLDQGQPGWNDGPLRAWLDNLGVEHTILREDTYSIVKEKVPEGKTYCSLCSRLRRGIIYRYAEDHGFNKIALGHHRDDLNASLLMSIFYNGEISSMPPKLLSDNKKHVVIRPLIYCQERDIIEYAKLKQYPIIPCNLCGSQEKLARRKISQLLRQLSEDNPKIPSNILHSMQSVKPSQLMDKTWWDFKGLEAEQCVDVELT